MTVTFAFVALFPGFFFYQSALGIGAIGPVLGGYFSPVTVLFAPILLVLYLFRVKQNRRFLTKTDFIFFGFLTYFFFVIALNFALGADKGIVVRHFLSIIHFLAVFIIFRTAEFGGTRTKWIAALCLAVMTGIIFSLSVDGSFYLRTQGESSDPDVLASYQGFARSYLFTFLVVVPFIKSKLVRAIVYSVSVPALFMNGARSELSALVVAVFLIEAYYAKYRFPVFLMVLFVALLFVLFSEQIVEALPINRSSSRALDLMNLDKSTSWSARTFLHEQALHTIGEYPLLGSYASYGHLGGAGAAAHNILSAWVDLGIVGFLYFVAMISFPMIFMTIDFFSKKGRREELLLTFSLLFVCLLLLFLAKSFTYMLAAAALGRYARYRSTNVQA
jgi:hypothetical protein